MADEAAGSAPGGNAKIMMGLLGLNVVVMVGVLVVLFLGNKKQQTTQTLDQVAAGSATPGAEAKPAEKGKEGETGKEGEKGNEGGAAEADVHFFSVGDFTANLSGAASTHYVRISVNFEMSKDADEEEFKARRPQFRDKVISLLNSKKPTDLEGAEGRNFLKEEIKTAVNTFIQKGKVEGVYFSTFIIN